MDKCFTIGTATDLNVTRKYICERGNMEMKEPAFKMILTAVGNLAYKREDGIYVVPISSLRN